MVNSLAPSCVSGICLDSGELWLSSAWTTGLGLMHSGSERSPLIQRLALPSDPIIMGLGKCLCLCLRAEGVGDRKEQAVAY